MLGKFFKSRKFLLMLFDLILVVTLVALSRYLPNPELFKDIYFVIAILQVPFIAMIRAITIEDVSQYKDFDPLPPLVMLFKSKQFWVTMLDIAIILFAYFMTKYSDPQMAKDAKWFMGLIQPMLLAVIEGWTQENAAVDQWFEPYPFPELPEEIGAPPTGEELYTARMESNGLSDPSDSVPTA